MAPHELPINAPTQSPGETYPPSNAEPLPAGNLIGLLSTMPATHATMAPILPVTYGNDFSDTMTSSSEHSPTNALSPTPFPLTVGARQHTHAHNSPALISTAPHLEPLTGNAQLPTNGSEIPEDMTSSAEPQTTPALSGNHQSTTTGTHPFPENHAWQSMPICPPRPAPSVPYEPSSRMAAIRDSIYEALFTRSYFYASILHASPRETSPEIHDRMHDLHFQRVAAEEALTRMLMDQTPDGTPIDPKLFNETKYQRLDTLVHTINRAMYTIYAQFLDMDPSLSCKAPPNNNMHPHVVVSLTHSANSVHPAATLTVEPHTPYRKRTQSSSPRKHDRER
jgi:hypothetical protein